MSVLSTGEKPMDREYQREVLARLREAYPNRVSASQTIKLDSDDLRALMVSRVEASDLPPKEKQRRIHAIRSFSASVLRDATVRWATEALVRLPDAVQLFQTGAGPS